MQVGSESKGQTQRNCEVSLEIQVVEFFLSSCLQFLPNFLRMIRHFSITARNSS